MANISVRLLAKIETNHAEHRAYTLQSTPNNEAALEALGVDKQGRGQYVDYLEELKSGSGIEAMINARFAPIVTKYRPSRFSDGSINVLYAALESDTAKEEVAYHKVKDSFRKSAIHKRLIGIDFEGDTKDLREQKGDWNGLTSDDYEFCQRLGREATELGLDGLLGPSVRALNGTNLSIFRRAGIRQFADLGELVFPSS